MPPRTKKYQFVSSRFGFENLMRRFDDGSIAALDFETTSLSPKDGRVRLVSLCNDDVHALVDFDGLRGGFRSVSHLFEGPEWVVFNRGFEQRWFNEAGSPGVRCRDVGNLRRAILGGGGYSLKQIVQWDLGIEMSKEQQTSNWDASTLSEEQLNYAYLDADLTWRLWRYWADQADAGRWAGFAMFDQMVPAVIEMEEAGMKLDKKYHTKLITHWESIRSDRVVELRQWVGEDEVPNLNSNAQWSDYFARIMPDHFLAGWPRTEKAGQLSTTGETLKKLAGAVPGTPFEACFDALAEYKTITKYLSSFGETLIDKAKMSPDGRVRARFNIAAAKTGRFSCSGPNLQQIPRDKELLGEHTSVRTSFVADLGRQLVSLDYSGIELRVLALLTDDEQLLADMVEGDVHSEVAAVIAGHPIDKTTPEGKAARTAAKGVSFGIIYGSGAAGLAVNMRTSVDNAQSYIDFWANRYPAAFNLRYDMMEEVARTRQIRAVDGGTIYMGKVPDLPKCSNYPVQRAALSIMARALVRHKNRLDGLRAEGRQRLTQMLSTIHDAIIDEAATADCEELLEIMEDDMVQGYLDVFPDAPIDNLVEGGTGPNWGQLG